MLLYISHSIWIIINLILLYMLWIPLIEFESSDYRGLNNQYRYFNFCNGIGIQLGLKIQFECSVVFQLLQLKKRRFYCILKSKLNYITTVSHFVFLYS